LYKTKLNGKGKAERLSPETQPGTHGYTIAPGSLLARHTFSNYFMRPMAEWISLPDHKWVSGSSKVEESVVNIDEKRAASNLSFFSVTTSDGIEMDGWMAKPADFDSTKKYPVLFYVYTEPWGQLVKDQYGAGMNHLYRG